MKVIFFDVETNGLPKKYNAAPTDLNNWPRVIQLAWAVGIVETGEIIRKESILIKPDGWTIPKEKFWIDNGYTTEQNELNGVSMVTELELFSADMSEAECMSAHNLAFDRPIVIAEMLRYKITPEQRQRIPICTMNASVEFCKLPFANNKPGYKWPKLEELHFKLFGTGFENAHDAGADVSAGLKCFFELKKLGIITFPE